MMHKSVLELSRHLPRLSLQEMSRIRIITTLCNDRQLLGLIVKCNFQTDLAFRLCARKGTEWAAVEAKANELVSQICNIPLFKKRILELLWPVCYRIMLWKSIYAPSIRNTFLQRFYWTERGRIDNKRTVRHIIRNKNIPLRRRFVLGCSVCLSEELHEMWREMSNKDKAYFYKVNNDKISPLLLFWVHTMEGSPCRCEFRILRDGALRSAIEIGLLEALKYLVAIYTEDEKNFRVNYTFDELICKFKFEDRLFFLEEDEIDIGYFLFSEMKDLAQQFCFDHYHVIVLSLLLHSSEYKLCLSLLEERLQSLSVDNLLIFLRVIFYTYHLEVVNDDDCRKLFVDVWRMIPTSKRSSLSDSDIAAEFLSVLINDNFPFLKEKEAFKKIAEFTSLDSRSCTSVQQFDFHQGKWKFLHFLIEEGVTTIPFLDKRRRHILPILKIRQSNQTAWNRVLRFVSNVARKNPQPRE